MGRFWNTAQLCALILVCVVTATSAGAQSIHAHRVLLEGVDAFSQSEQLTPGTPLMDVQTTRVDGNELCCGLAALDPDSNPGADPCSPLDPPSVGDSITVNNYWTVTLDPVNGYLVDFDFGVQKVYSPGAPGLGVYLSLFEDEVIDFGDILDAGVYTLCVGVILELPENFPLDGNVIRAAMAIDSAEGSLPLQYLTTFPVDAVPAP